MKRIINPDTDIYPKYVFKKSSLTIVCLFALTSVGISRGGGLFKERAWNSAHEHSTTQ